MTASPVRIEDEAFSDPRIELLGSLCGYNRFEALGRLAHLWRMCTRRGEYCVSPAIIAACLGDAGPAAIVTAELGEETPDGIRVKGTEGRIEWRQQYVQQPSSTKAAAGRARAQNAPRDARGRLLPRSAAPAGPADVQQDPSSTSSRSPAEPAALTLPPEEEIPPARAIPPSTEYGRTGLRRRLFGAMWQFSAAEYQAAKISGLDPHAKNCWSAMPAASSPEAKALLAIIDDLAPGDSPEEFDRAGEAIRNRVLVSLSEAKHKHGHLQFCTPMRMWNRESFAIAAALTPAQVEQTARLPARGSQSSRYGPPKVLRPHRDDDAPPPLPPAFAKPNP